MTKVVNINEAPKRSILEEVGNAVTHGIGAVLGIVATILMLIKVRGTVPVIACSIYGVCLTLLMTISCLYHSFRSQSKVKRIFRRFDYSSIYLLIGGTFAPLFLIYEGGVLGLVLFIIQWVLIIFGITMISVFGPGRLRWLHFSLYFILGWSAIIFIPSWIRNDLLLFVFVLIGGLFYSLGMIPFVLKNKKGAHFIWHFFVLFGAIFQWIGIYLYLI